MPLCVARAAVKSIRLEDGKLVVSCTPRKGQRCVCPHCAVKRPVYDRSPTPRRWRALDLGATMTFVECAAVRVDCPVHGRRHRRRSFGPSCLALHLRLRGASGMAVRALQPQRRRPAHENRLEERQALSASACTTGSTRRREAASTAWFGSAWTRPLTRRATST